MRTKHQPLSRSQPPPSPPLSAATPAMSTYSALVSPVSQAHPEKPDEAHPFRYSKNDLLRIYREGTKGGLALEVERWEGVVRELGSEPIGLREMGDAERKLFTGPLNSDLRRRQSTDYLSPLNTSALGIERPRMALNTTSATGSPSRERFGTLKRHDSNTEPPASNISRKQSLSALQTHAASPRNVALPSPRSRAGFMPNFDGVLNNGDSWTSRRRASEASLKSGAATYRDSGGDWEHDDKNAGIREEKEEEVGADAERRTRPPLVTSLAAEHTQSESRSDLYPSSDAFDSESRGHTQSHHGYANPLDPLGATGIHNSFSDVRDLAGVEWSYKDPTGQVQGPFRADLMQKWYDDGYFSVDLPMKRTHLDSQWITVEELAKLTRGDKIFLSPFVPVLPPGLSLQNGSPLQPLHSIANQNVFSNPYQPAPVRSLRSSTLDSYIGTGSNPSDSPSSSFGTGRFGDSSPDPSSFGGRASSNLYFGGDSAGLGYPATPDTGPLFASRRPSHDYAHDPALALRSPSFGNVPVGQGPLLDVYERVTGYASAQGPWSQDTFGAEPAIMVSSSTYNDLSNRPTIISSDSLPGAHRAHQIYGNGDAGNPHNALHEDNQTHGPSNTILDRRLLSHSPVQEYLSAQQPDTGHRISPDHTTFTPPSGSQGASPIIAEVATPWKSVQEESQSRRPGPFEVPHPTSTNTISVPATHAQPSPWGRGSHISRPSSQSNEPSPWVVASQGILEDPWKDPEPSGSTVTNGGQHNQQHEGPECSVVSPKETQDQIISSQGIPEPVTSSEDLSVPTAQSKIITPIQHSKPTSQVAESSAPTPPTPKVAWVKEEEKKKSRAPGVPLSLRGIQEAEAKKAESRKAAERERERAARGSTAVDGKEDVQPFTASWGLPTSQTGARGGVSVKESLPTVSAAPNNITLPVWTTPVKPPAAKTMKEIQEEEEKRKKLAIKETAATATAKRAYADSTAKVVITPNLTQSNNAWTTVGPSGKLSSPALTAVRPTVLSPSGSSTPINSSPSVRVNGARSAALPAAVLKPTAPAPKAEDFPATPSHDFLKWLSESLKGLNKTVNVEEIMAMLLSFSLDPDPSTIELISDTIYEHSTTLDGRRFASDFVSKRKADAAARPKGVSTTSKTPAKPVSIADVVKATPKTAQPEWGFKVVNKKKKGNRA